jgi:PAS domain S-box-containing protein
MISTHRLTAESAQEPPIDDAHARAAVDAAPIPMVYLTNEGEVRFRNRAYAEALGYTTAELEGIPFDQLTEPRSEQRANVALGEAVRDGQSIPVDLHLVHKDGHVVEFELRIARVEFEGRSIGLMASFRDVTNERAAARALEENEKLLRAVFDSASIGLSLVAADGERLMANRAFAEIFGIEPKASLEVPRESLVSEDDIPRIYDYTRAIFAGGEGTSPLMLDIPDGLNGETHPLQLSAKRIEVAGELIGVLTTFTDLTEERATHRALEESRRQHRKAQELAHLGHWDRNFVTNELTWSDEVYRIFGLTPVDCDAIAPPFLQSVHPDDRSMVQAAIQRAVEDGEQYDCCHRVVRPDGTTRFVREIGDVTRTADGSAVRMLGTVLDITERKALDDEMHRLNRELATSAREHQALAQRLLTTQEDERRTVAYELHDGPAQQLAAAQMFLETFTYETNIDYSAGPGAHLAEVKTHLESGLAETRRIMSGLRPAQLDDLGLQDAVRQLLSNLAWDAEVNLDLHGIDSVGQLSPEIEITLYRVVQEAIGNALRHSGTDRLAVRLTADDAVVSLEIRDWGSGFDPHSIPQPSAGHGYGLVGMRERVSLLNGEFRVISDLGRGTTIEVTIPHHPAR